MSDNLKAGEWISVKDRLPEIEDTVDIWVTCSRWSGDLSNGRRECSYHRLDSKYVKGWRKSEDLHYYNMLHQELVVTHWMPLPNPPQNEQ